MNIADEDLAVIKDILGRYAPDCKAWAYGSRVRGDNRKYSDIDLVLLPQTAISFEKLCDLRAAFEESDLPISVDLNCWDDITESFRDIIRSDHAVVV